MNVPSCVERLLGLVVGLSVPIVGHVVLRAHLASLDDDRDIDQLLVYVAGRVQIYSARVRHHPSLSQCHWRLDA